MILLEEEMQVADKDERLQEKIRLSVTRAYLLYLSGNPNDAENIVKESLRNAKISASPSLNLLLRKNQLCCQLLDSHKELEHAHYVLKDLETLLNVPEQGEKLLAQAKAAVEEDKHPDALPAFWQYLLLNYEMGLWNAFWKAEKSFSIECCRLGWFDRAIYHSMIALDSQQGKSVANVLLASRKRDTIRLSIHRILPNAKLICHAKIVADFIAELGDAVPADMVDEIIDFLLQRATLDSSLTGRTNASISAWKALASIAPLLSTELADRIANHSRSLDIPIADIRVRREILICLQRILPHASLEVKRSFVDFILPIATTNKNSFDYRTVINLLCGIAEDVGGTTKMFIGDALLPEGRSQVSPLLMQLMPHFGKALENQLAIDELVLHTCASVRNQVQKFILGQAEKAKEQPGTICYSTFQKPDGSKVTVCIGGDAQLFALISNKGNLSKENIKQLLSCILEMLREPENLPNKAHLCMAIEEISDRIPIEMAQEIWETLSEIAEGKSEPGHFDKLNADAQNPLNPYKMNVGSSLELRGNALFTLASIERRSPGMFGEKLENLMGKVSKINDSNVKIAVFAAIRDIPCAPENLLVTLLWGLRHSDPRVASSAFWAIAGKANLSLDSFKTSMVIDSIRESSKSPDASVRRAAAAVLNRLLMDIGEDGEVARNLRQMREEFLQDISFSVRAQITNFSKELNNME